MTNANIKQNFLSVFLNAQREYDKRHDLPMSNVVTQKDIKAGLDLLMSMTEGQLKEIEKMGIDFARFQTKQAQTSNVKSNRRTAQFLMGVITGDARYFSASARTALLGFISLLSGVKSKDVMNLTVTGTGVTSIEGIDPVTLQRVQRVIGKTRKCSVGAQLPVSFKRSGILDTLGIIDPSEKRNELPTVRRARVTNQVIKFVSRLTDDQIEQIAQNQTA